MRSAACWPRIWPRAGRSRPSRYRRWTATRCAPRMWRTVPVELRIVAEVPAGAGFGGHVGAGEAARIFTGAPMPAGTDTIVIQEDTERDGDRVRVLEGARARPLRAPRGARFRRGRRAAAGRTAADGARHRPRRGDEPAVAVRASPAAGRHPVDRRRDRHARRSDRAAPDRQLEQPGARRLCRGLRRHPGVGRQRPRRPRRRCARSPPRRAASICW